MTRLRSTRDRRRFAVFPLALASLLVASVTGVGAQEAPEPSKARSVTPATVKAWLEEGRAVTFLDVREADEFAAGRLPGAINIRHDEVAVMAERLPRREPIVLYCIHSAHRAPAAARALQALGFDNASVLEGGIVAWQAGGLTLRARDLANAPTILPKTERCDAAGQQSGVHSP